MPDFWRSVVISTVNTMEALRGPLGGLLDVPAVILMWCFLRCAVHCDSVEKVMAQVDWKPLPGRIDKNGTPSANIPTALDIAEEKRSDRCCCICPTRIVPPRVLGPSTRN